MAKKLRVESFQLPDGWDWSICVRWDDPKRGFRSYHVPSIEHCMRQHIPRVALLMAAYAPSEPLNKFEVEIPGVGSISDDRVVEDVGPVIILE